MSETLRTLAENMSLAVLKGDLVAAYALADLLQERAAAGPGKLAEAARAQRAKQHRVAADGYEVYQWPEFKAFCRRAGIAWDLNTVDMEFRIVEGEALVINHRYYAVDTGGAP